MFHPDNFRCEFDRTFNWLFNITVVMIVVSVIFTIAVYGFVAVTGVRVLHQIEKVGVEKTVEEIWKGENED